MLTANHQRVTCWNENPFFPHDGVDDRHFLRDTSGSERSEGEKAGVPHIVGSIQYRMRSITIFVLKWGRAHNQAVFQGRYEGMLSSETTDQKPVFPSSWLPKHTEGRLPLSCPTEKQPQTGEPWSDAFISMKTLVELLVKIPEWIYIPQAVISEQMRESSSRLTI